MKHWPTEYPTLREEERAARKDLTPSVDRVTKGKATVAMKELLESLGYPDSLVCDLIREGFKLVGDFEHCPVFDMKPEDEEFQGADPDWLGLKATEIRADVEAQHSRTKMTTSLMQFGKKRMVR